MIKFHGYQRIAFIRGNETNIEAEKRFEIYKDVIAENKLPFIPDLIFKGNFQITDGENAIRYLIDEKKLKFDAIVASNHSMAVGVIQALNKRRILIPDQIAVAGFDNLEESKYLSPPLTTAGIILKNCGHKAVELIIKQLNNDNVIPLTKLDSKLIVRQSCGCKSKLILNDLFLIKNNSKLKPLSFLLANKNQLIKKIMQIMNYSKENNKLANSIVDGLITEIKEKKIGFFIEILYNVLKRFDDLECDVEVWLDIICLMQKEIPHNITSIKHLETIWNQSKLLIIEYIQISQAKKFLQNSKFFTLLNIIRNRLSGTFELNEIIDILLENLPIIDIGTSFLCLYEACNSYIFPEAPPKWSRIMLVLNENNKILLNKDNNRFLTRDLLPKNIWLENTQFNFIILPLHFREEPFGYIIFKAGLKNLNYYEALSEQISSSIKGTILVKKMENHTIELDKAYKELKNNQKKLLESEKIASLGRLIAGIAHEMNTPLATIHAAIKEINLLINEYSLSINNPDVLPEDHKEIISDMLKYADVVLKATKKTASFIRGIKGHSRNPDDNIRITFNASHIIQDTLTLLEFRIKKSCCKVNIKLNESILLQGNPRWISQIITNLVNNAIDACSKKNGIIKIKLNKFNENKAKLIVQDNGEGISSENISKIYDPLFTTKPFGEATGLGLSIVTELIDLFGGTINVSSKPGLTIFTIELPLAK